MRGSLSQSLSIQRRNTSWDGQEKQGGGFEPDFEGCVGCGVGAFLDRKVHKGVQGWSEQGPGLQCEGGSGQGEQFRWAAGSETREAHPVLLWVP